MKQHIENLIAFEIECTVIEERDYDYVKNQLYYLLGIENDGTYIEPVEIPYPAAALEPILDELEKKGVLDGSQIARDLFDAKLMNVFAKLPSDVEHYFYKLYGRNRRRATTWYYNYVKNLNYIREDRQMKNQSFETKSKYGKLEITINLSKPEKDPKSIELAGKNTSTDYPKCVLCLENEGFSGNYKRDARDQHRLIEVMLGSDVYYFQYSPYSYYNEHAIVLNSFHIPMLTDSTTFINLLELCDQFEHYFFGANADIPIVGGSILSHDHYQGGRHKFPIEDAEIKYTWDIDDIKLHLLKWPLTTLRLEGKDKHALMIEATNIYTIWRNYCSEELKIYAYTNNQLHNTVTPIARKKGAIYQIDLILRNNYTNDEFPLGMYHPHQDKWHIKKENIGLIEAMGLAVLPARLKKELEEVKAYLLEDKPLSKEAEIHQFWADSMKIDFDITKDNCDDIIKQEIGRIFEGVLEDCGVFKDNEQSEDKLLTWIKEYLL